MCGPVRIGLIWDCPEYAFTYGYTSKPLVDASDAFKTFVKYLSAGSEFKAGLSLTGSHVNSKLIGFRLFLLEAGFDSLTY